MKTNRFTVVNYSVKNGIYYNRPAWILRGSNADGEIITALSFDSYEDAFLFWIVHK